ncbi:beta-phosphoglucomutase family hydrolase [Prauserella alba]|uniref:Beta-phosphoglucomutase n=1 Tax=Prauserella alba TaxID=176898 RepID=A0ABN1VHX2_9PSEU|nr:beta-phosphoglucomutase family hydrolase [Prauserella alba]MCP2180527.1 haloacid dehalogenase superfamily, subfamily IA, variant 3 with third motif having DD or ED/beta-phosphoglucomutase family hydrolase [Prauserella alba]
MIGLPATISACLFDLDGVLTSTASLHRAAWKRTFDELLARHGQTPFTDEDYATYVDGRPRLDGVRAFLASRGLDPPEGGTDDPPDAETVHGIGTRKNDLVLRLIDETGVTPFPGSVRYLKAVQEAGLAIGVVTSSANAAHVLGAAGLDGFVQARVDGVTISGEGLRGKPAPDSFLACARLLGAAPDAAAVFEDALAGVEAGRAGGFGHVVGVDRAGQPAALREHGADVVVADLADLLEVS